MESLRAAVVTTQLKFPTACDVRSARSANDSRVVAVAVRPDRRGRSLALDRSAGLYVDECADLARFRKKSFLLPQSVGHGIRASATAAPAAPVEEIELRPVKNISGTIKLPGSKSLSNRILLLAALAEGTTVVDNLLDSDDVRYMVGALKQLGIKLTENWDTKQLIVEGCGGLFPAGNEEHVVELFLGNAGTAMRPLTAAVAVAGGKAK